MFKQTLVNTVTYLAAGDPFESTKTLATNGVAKFQLIATAVFVLVLVVTGIVYAFAGRELKGTIKKKWTDVGIAVVVVYGASMAISWFVQFVQNTGLK